MTADMKKSHDNVVPNVQLDRIPGGKFKDLYQFGNSYLSIVPPLHQIM